MNQMAKAEDVTEQLKREDQMAWVGAMNNNRNRAEEIVLEDLILQYYIRRGFPPQIDCNIKEAQPCARTRMCIVLCPEFTTWNQ